MVSNQVTHNDKSSHQRPNDWKPRSSDESVRITAEVPLQVRRRVLREFLQQEESRQAAISASESNDLKVRRANGLPTAVAELRASNAAAVLQYIGATLKAFGDDNRDYEASGVAR